MSLNAVRISDVVLRCIAKDLKCIEQQLMHIAQLTDDRNIPFTEHTSAKQTVAIDPPIRRKLRSFVVRNLWTG